MPEDPISASVGIATSSLGSALRDLLNADELRPGDDVSYQLCKSLYIHHPLGGKMAETPIRLAQSEDREIAVPDSPEDEVVRAYKDEWDGLECSDQILNVMTQARVYGATTVALGEKDGDVSEAVDLATFWRKEPYFNVFDPLNTAGSLVTDQNPNSPMFQKWRDIVVQGQHYHRSRTCTMLNEKSIYLAWSSASFGYVGRSVYQRSFFPLKSFLWTMVTDEMVARKAGIIVARLETPGSIIDRVMQAMQGLRRAILRQARAENVISIGKDEIIETLNLRNVGEAMQSSRDDIIKNIATAADMPAKMLTQESFVEGFGEGTQDAYAVAQYINRIRVEMRRIYDFYDLICQYRAWNPEFYETIQRRYYKEYGNVDHKVALYRWRRSFTATWPSLIQEKPSEAVDIEDVKLKAMIALVQVLAPMVDPENRGRVIQWLTDQVNTNEVLFGGAVLELDMEGLVDHLLEEKESQDQMQEQEGSGEPPKPFSSRDSTQAVAYLNSWMKNSRPMRALAAARVNVE